MRWANEERYDNLIQVAAGNYDIPADLIRAVISTESQFQPQVVRKEATDQSIGLMQILYGTAKGEGYTGPLGDPTLLSGLFSPAANITFGASYLAGQYHRAGGNIASAASAYNGGWRPDIGFGAPATRPLSICLAKDTTGKCIRSRAVKVGEYSNKPYVDAVLANLEYFRNKVPPVTVPVATGGVAPPLVSANQSLNNESQTDWRIGGSAHRAIGTQIWDTISQVVRWILQWFK